MAVYQLCLSLESHKTFLICFVHCTLNSETKHLRASYDWKIDGFNSCQFAYKEQELGTLGQISIQYCEKNSISDIKHFKSYISQTADKNRLQLGLETSN